MGSARIQEKRDTLHMLAINVIATTDALNIEGIISKWMVPYEFGSASVELTQGCTNMGMSVRFGL